MVSRDMQLERSPRIVFGILDYKVSWDRLELDIPLYPGICSSLIMRQVMFILSSYKSCRTLQAEIRRSVEAKVVRTSLDIT